MTDDLDRVDRAYRNLRETRRVVRCRDCDGDAVRRGRHGVVRNSVCQTCNGFGLVLR